MSSEKESEMKLIAEQNEEQRNSEAAEAFLQAIESAAAKKEKVLLAFCGGRSPLGIFCALMEDSRLKRLKSIGEKLELFLIDERAVPLESPEANFAVLEKNLFTPLEQAGVISRAQVHPFTYQQQSDDFGASAYTEELKKFGDAFDVVLLGSGEDGHVAGLFPGVSAENQAPYFFGFSGSPKPPSERVSASRSLILRSGFVLLLFVGEGKREAYQAFKQGETPSAMVRELEHVVVVTDLE